MKVFVSFLMLQQIILADYYIIIMLLDNAIHQMTTITITDDLLRHIRIIINNKYVLNYKYIDIQRSCT